MTKTEQAEKVIYLKAWRWMKSELESRGGLFPDIPQDERVKLMLGLFKEISRLCIEHRDSVHLDDGAFPVALSDFAASVLWSVITFDSEEEVEKYANTRCLAGDLIQAFASAVMATEMVNLLRMTVHDADDAAVFLSGASSALEVGSTLPET